MRRFTRLTNTFSKKVEKLHAAVALHFVRYNLVRPHKTLWVIPAIEAGVSDRLWSLTDLIEQTTKARRLDMANDFPDDISFEGWCDVVDVEEFEIEDVIEAIRRKQSTGDFEVKTAGKITSIWRRDQPEAKVKIVSPDAEEAFVRQIRSLPIESETERGFREVTSNPKA